MKKTTEKDQKNKVTTILKKIIFLPILLTPSTQAPTATAGTTIFTSTTPFKKFCRSKNKYVAITGNNQLYLTPITGQTTPQIISLNASLVDTTRTYVGGVSCFSNDDTCVVCGANGCNTFTFFANGSYNFLKHYNHNRWNFTNTAGVLTKDYVYDVLAIEQTTFFFTIESMKGTNSSGLLRYDYHSLSCYNRFSAALADDQGREYHLGMLHFTKNIAVSGPATKNIWIFNIQLIAAPLVSITFADANGFVGSISDINISPEVMHLITCAHNDKTKACTVIDYSKPSVTVIKNIDISAVSTSVVAGIDQVKVTSYPQSNYVAIAWNTDIIIASSRNGDNYVQKVQSLTLTTVLEIQADFHYADLHILTANSLIPYKLAETDTEKKCHEGCPSITTKASDHCGNDHYQSAGCIAGKCATGFIANTPMVCYKAPTANVPLGGLVLTPNLALPFTTTDQICSNATTNTTNNSTNNATSNGTGPFANVSVTPMSSGLRIFWIIFLSMLLLIVVGVVFILMNMRTGKAKEKKFRQNSMGFGALQGGQQYLDGTLQGGQQSLDPYGLNGVPEGGMLGDGVDNSFMGMGSLAGGY